MRLKSCVPELFGESYFQEGRGPVGGKADSTAAGRVVKKIKPSPQLSVFTNVNVDLLFLNPQETPKRGLCLWNLNYAKKKSILVGNAADPRPEALRAARGSQKGQGEGRWGMRGLRWNISGTVSF